MRIAGQYRVKNYVAIRFLREFVIAGYRLRRLKSGDQPITEYNGHLTGGRLWLVDAPGKIAAFGFFETDLVGERFK